MEIAAGVKTLNRTNIALHMVFANTAEQKMNKVRNLN